MNPDIQLLHSYPFEKLASLKSGITPPTGLSHISLSIGEPKHEPPAFALQALTENLQGLASYPLTSGTLELRQAICQWASNRYGLAHLSATQVLPVNGTREALFAIAQALVDRTQNAIVQMPNPFYQIYEGAALLAGATPYYLNCTANNQYLPDFNSVPSEIWQRTQLVYICNPGNPTGAVIPPEQLQALLALADQHDFVIASDECYSEIYFEQSPPGLLSVCEQLGRNNYHRCLVFQSLSKRSNLPGLRSGFVAGDQTLVDTFLKYRTYHGSAMALPVQAASIAAWGDETHVQANRDLYAEKFRRVAPILAPHLSVTRPDAAFFFWAKTPINDEQFARDLFAQQNVTVLPGSYLAREAEGLNPGANHVRMALVAELDECLEAAHRIADYVAHLKGEA